MNYGFINWSTRHVDNFRFGIKSTTLLTNSTVIAASNNIKLCDDMYVISKC